jgi:ComEC/Rec2-related protein
MKQPLALPALAYVAGLLLAQRFPVPLTVLFAAAFFLLVLVLVLEKTRFILLFPLLALCGWTNFATRTAIISPNDLRPLLGSAPAIVTVRGELAETPRLKISERDGEEIWRSVARVRVNKIVRDENNFPADGEILTTTPGILESRFFAGQRVEISGVITPPSPPLAEGLFDQKSYLAARGIFYELKTESTNDWKILEPKKLSPPLTDKFLNWSHRTLAFGLPTQDEPLRLLWAMTLGWRTAFTGDLADPFLRAGTMHMFAIDGLRIALLSGLIVTFLRVLRLSRAWCGALAVPMIWFYTAATGWEPSAVRASVMMTIVLGGWALKRPGDLLNSLAAAALIILIWDPRQLFEASFQLSFFVMLIIALMLPPLNNCFDRLLKHDPLLPDELLPGWKKISLWCARHFLRYCGLSFAAWMGSLPLSAKFFHLFSPVSTPANVLAVPLGTAALTANLGALLCGDWLPWFTELFNHAAWFFMVAMTWVSEVSTKIPGAYCYVPEPSWAWVLIYYAVLVAAFSGWLTTRRRKIIGAGVLFFLIVAGFVQWQLSRSETQITVLPLNGGHAIHLDADGRQDDWLINCGNENAVNFTLKNFLRAHGVNQIPRLVLTSGDLRNCGGAMMLDDLFGTGELWTSDEKFRSSAYRSAVALFEKTSRHKVFHAGETNGCWEILFPTGENKTTKADDRPLVLRGNVQGTKILLLSDLSRAGQNALMAAQPDLRADIVVAGLPTQGEPLNDALIEAIAPHVIVIADSEQPATRRASRGLQERLAEKKIPVICTRASGAVKISATTEGWKLQTMDGQVFSFQR